MTAGRRPRRPDLRLRARGFTLIELLIVIVILGLLLSLVAPTMFSKVGSSQRKAAMAQMQMLATSLDTYRLDVDRKSTRLNSSHVSESRMPSSA